MDSLFEGVQGSRLRKAILAAVILLALFLGIKALAEFSGLRYVGAGIPPTNVISVSGYGEALAVPDIATFTFSVTSSKPTVAAAQTEATAKINEITEYLAGAGIEEKDIKTTDYSVYPQYEYSQSVCPAASTGISYCPPGKQVLRGYEVRQTTTVKVRNTEAAGDLLTGVGGKGATEVSGLNFTFDDPDAVQDQARDEAISDAKEKAEILAKQLGVKLVRVVSFSENGSSPSPMYYARDTMNSMGGAELQAAKAPELSVGENKVTSNVSVTYEIR